MSGDRRAIVLAGRFAAPLPDPGARGSLRLSGRTGRTPLLATVLPGEISICRLSADLGTSARPPRCFSLQPYDLDPRAMDTLVSRAQPDGGVVVESPDAGQAERFLGRLTGGSPIVVLRYRRPRRAWRIPADLPWEARLEQLTGGRPALHDSILDAAQRFPPADFAIMVERSRTADDLTARLVRALLDGADTDVHGLAASLRYLHPRFGSLAPAYGKSGLLPWWIPLSDDWLRLDPAWQPGVLRTCRADRRPPVALLGRLAGELIEDGATDAAIELCLDTGCAGMAGDLLAGMGPDLIDAGRGQSVRRWLRRLPWTQRLPGNRLLRHRLSPAGPSPPEPPAEQPAPPAPAEKDLVVQLLGIFDVRLAGQPVDHWHGRKGALLFAYLMLHRHDPPISRDKLAAALWLDAAASAAPNRLHVTVHALRADLHAVAPIPVVEFEGGYRIDPSLDIRLDTEQFQLAAARAAAADVLGDSEAALRACRDAAALYRGDLLEQHPSEDWLLLPREQFRVRHLELLARLAQTAFDTGRYDEALEVGQRLLALDFCREDVHRLLMRGHTRRGRPQEAIRQYEACAEQLRRELGMAPAAETVELYERIRGRSPV